MHRQSSYRNIPTVDASFRPFPAKIDDENRDEEVPGLHLSLEFDSSDESIKQTENCNMKLDDGGCISDDDISYGSEGSDYDLFTSCEMLSDILDDDLLTEDCFSDSSSEDDLSSIIYNDDKDEEKETRCRKHTQLKAFKSQSEPKILTRTFSLNTIVEENSDFEEEASTSDPTLNNKVEQRANIHATDSLIRSKSETGIHLLTFQQPSHEREEPYEDKSLTEELLENSCSASLRLPILKSKQEEMKDNTKNSDVTTGISNPMDEKTDEVRDACNKSLGLWKIVIKAFSFSCLSFLVTMAEVQYNARKKL